MQKAVLLGEQLGRGTVLEVPEEMVTWDESRLKEWMSSLTNVEGKLNVYTTTAAKN